MEPPGNGDDSPFLLGKIENHFSLLCNSNESFKFTVLHFISGKRAIYFNLHMVAHNRCSNASP